VQEPGFFTAAVPITDVGDAVFEIALDRLEVADAAARAGSGISSPITLTISRIASSFFGTPATAPFKSTMCRRSAPSSSQC
jgi:hypothetical protein